MQADHPALLRSLQHPPAHGENPCLGLALLASDYVCDRVQIVPASRSIFSDDQLHIEINTDTIEQLAQELFSAFVLEIVRQPLQAAVATLLEGKQSLPPKEAVMQKLRLLRHTVMLRIIGRIACYKADCQQILKEISALADWCIAFATHYAELELATRHGIAPGEDGKPMRLLVIAMGKLGSSELNLSSDIDLIFVAPENGTTAMPDSAGVPNKGTESIDSSVYFSKVGRLIIALLGQITSDGFVFRTDMRLRPYGDSGALISHVAELETYYHEQARTWERYAFTRARILTGNQEHKQQLASMIEGFVYRRHIDFSVIGQLRELIANIRLMTHRRQTENNIKTGIGGIREIEFLAQGLQLIYGGVFPQLRAQNTSAILSRAGAQQLLLQETSTRLGNHYLWLRDLENRLQAMKDEQTQQLPDDEKQLARIAAGMGYLSSAEFMQQLAQVQNEVHQAFTRFLEQENPTAAAAKQKVATAWQQLAAALFAGNKTALATRLAACEHTEGTTQESLAALQSKLEDFFSRVPKLSEQAQATLGEIMPLILRSCFATHCPVVCLVRVFELLGGITRRSTYLTLLQENPSVIPWLAVTFASSNWCARQVTERPMLLACFIENTRIWQKPDRTEILQQLQLQLFSLPESDMEQEMDTLRNFALAKRMQVALAQLSENMSLMQVSDHLSFTAEVCLEAASRIAWRQLSYKHGTPGEDDLSGFVILAYGKLGGLEMSYASDLDLVFVFDQPADPDGMQLTNGATKPITTLQFYQRLAQRIIHLLGAPTAAGFAYKIDSRLRPNGQKGLLCSTLDSWVDYYQNHAWTWEMQALIRARPICGSPRVIQACQQARQQLLTSHRDPGNLRQDVIAMRERMLQTHGSTGNKHMRGGLVDIEFIVQYLALKHAQQHPEITFYSDNKRILRALAKNGFIAASTAQAVQQTYLSLRNINHNTYTESEATETPDIGVVVELWNMLFADKTPQQGN